MRVTASIERHAHPSIHDSFSGETPLGDMYAIKRFQENGATLREIAAATAQPLGKVRLEILHWLWLTAPEGMRR